MARTRSRPLLAAVVTVALVVIASGQQPDESRCPEPIRSGIAATAAKNAESVPIVWETTLEKAMARGRREKKPVFIRFNVNFLGNPKDEKC